MLFNVNLKCIKKNIYEIMHKKVSLTKNSHVNSLNSTKSIFQWGCEAKICILLLLLDYNFKLKGKCGPSICFKFRLAVIVKSYNWISSIFFQIAITLIISFLWGHSTTTWIPKGSFINDVRFFWVIFEPPPPPPLNPIFTFYNPIFWGHFRPF